MWRKKQNYIRNKTEINTEMYRTRRDETNGVEGKDQDPEKMIFGQQQKKIISKIKNTFRANSKLENIQRKAIKGYNGLKQQLKQKSEINRHVVF